MDGTTGGRCQGSYAISEYHHVLREIFTKDYRSAGYAVWDGDSAND